MQPWGWPAPPIQQPQPPYASPLLNEIHTLFPALLYDAGRFSTVYSVLSYVQQQMSQRYDIYSNARRQWREANPRRPVVPQRRVAVPPPFVPAAAPTVRVSSEVDPSLLPAIISALPTAFLSQALLGALSPGAQTATFFDPVVVAPTSEQIARGSLLLIQPGQSDTPCAICQDTIQDGDTIRLLRACRHTFHRACVDVWFQRNVHCPVCRHDIRIVPTQPDQPTTPSTQPPEPSSSSL
jgi:Ring finger domain